MDARDRHQRQIEEKLRLKEQRQIEEDHKRMINAAARGIAVEKKRRNEANIATMNQVRR